MIAFLNRHPDSYAFMCAFAPFLIIAVMTALLSLSVQAAPAEPVPPCVVVATAATIIVSFCETDYGDFFINSMGFMVVAP